MPSFASLFAAAAAFSAAVLAQDPNFDSINTPLKNAEVPAGQPFTITWSLLSATTPTGPATITLIGGATTNNLSPVAVIGHVQNEDLKFVWNVDPSLGALAVYGLNLTLDADTSHFQYSNPFTIVGGSASGTPSGSGSGTPSESGSASGTATSGSGSATGTSTGTTSVPTTVITTTSSAEPTTTAPTTTAAPTHASNSTSNSTSSSTASKTSPATKPTTTSGANSLSGLSAVGAVALALVASAAMNWGL